MRQANNRAGISIVCRAMLFAMLILSVVAIAVLFAPSGYSAQSTENRVLQIAETWGEVYRDFPERATYHYRCTANVTRLDADVALGPDVFPFVKDQFGIEISRLAGSTRSVVSSNDFAHAATEGWIQIAGGRGPN